MSSGGLDFSHSAEHYHVMHLLEEAERARLSIVWVERLHLLFAGMLCFASFLVAFHWMDLFGWALAGGMGVLCLAALGIGHALRIGLEDLYRQFHYREKFLLFLIHMALVIIVRYVAGITDWSMVLGILLAFLCLQGINAVFFGRIYAAAAAIVFLEAGFGDPPPPASLLVGWLILLMLSIRFGYVRFRLERFGTEKGVDLYETLRRSIVISFVPAIIGYAAFWVCSRWMTQRTFSIQPPAAPPAGTDVSISYSQIFWESFFFVACIIGLLALLNWLEKKLRRRKGTAGIEEEMAPTTVREYALGEMDEGRLAVDEAGGPRERILTAFRRFADQLGRLNHGRHEDETAEEFFDRIGGVFPVLSGLEATAASPFNRACYDDETLTDQEAESFVEELDERLENLRRDLSRKEEQRNEDQSPD